MDKVWESGWWRLYARWGLPVYLSGRGIWDWMAQWSFPQTGAQQKNTADQHEQTQYYQEDGGTFIALLLLVIIVDIGLYAFAIMQTGITLRHRLATTGNLVGIHDHIYTSKKQYDPENNSSNTV